MSDEVNNVFKKYLYQLQLHPLRTNAITVAVLAGFSDAVAQKLSGANKLQLEGYFFSWIRPLQRSISKQLFGLEKVY
ncbi:hypothetical protein GYH30_054473 [Glycine max]|nr:hypothetical protein GYH30_054473 [Glycine max]